MSMRLLITGICGFVGSSIARYVAEQSPNWSVVGFDNFIRPGSVWNRSILRERGIDVFDADLRDPGLHDLLPACDWVIDCAANPSVLAGVVAGSPSKEVLDHNLIGTINLLEYCKRQRCGLVLVSTSRVYSADRLSRLPCRVENHAYVPDLQRALAEASKPGDWTGLGELGLQESFSTAPPLSLYGVSKLASEWLAMEYASLFSFPLVINRCGVLAGAGQFGRGDQGIVAYWIHAFREGRPLRYLGFDGLGHQVRDCLHPHDLARLIALQVTTEPKTPRGPDARPSPLNVSGGMESAFSLRQLTDWCRLRWRSDRPASLAPESDFRPRPFDCPWIVLDSSEARREWGWSPEWTREAIWEEIAVHAERFPGWLDLSDPPRGP